MANAFKKMAGYLGLVDDEADFEATVAMEIPQKSVRVTPPSAAARTVAASAPIRERVVAPVAPVAPVTPVAAQAELPILDSIFTIHPRFYNEARTVGEHFREGQPVLMNLSDMEESERKRLVDFASGLVFGHHGSIERVTSKVFLLTPANVRVSSEHKAAAAEASFFNQS
jgi:cell division inhibitor SepF